MLGENLYQQQQQNVLLITSKNGKNSQENILSNKSLSNSIQNKLLYFFLKDGGVVVYNMNEFVNIMRRDIFSYV
jgi:hypothetical protein